MIRRSRLAWINLVAFFVFGTIVLLSITGAVGVTWSSNGAEVFTDLNSNVPSFSVILQQTQLTIVHVDPSFEIENADGPWRASVRAIFEPGIAWRLGSGGPWWWSSGLGYMKFGGDFYSISLLLPLAAWAMLILLARRRKRARGVGFPVSFEQDAAQSKSDFIH